jgi:hypothetical protein
MSVAADRALYYFLRSCLALLGLFFLASLLYPDVVHSESSRPSWQNVFLDVALLLYGSLLLVPFRWLRQSPLFPVALLVFTLGVLWAVYAGLSDLVGLAQGRKSWLLLPASAIFVVLALIAPAALLMWRRIDVVKQAALLARRCLTTACTRPRTRCFSNSFAGPRGG